MEGQKKEQVKEPMNAPNMLLFGAVGRNQGKTRLAVRMVEKYSKTRLVVGIKVITVRNHGDICPRGGKGCGICKGLKDCYDVREEQGDGDKDTMLMKKAGAKTVYLVRAYPEGLSEALADVLGRIPEDSVVVCESNSVRSVVKPGVFFMMDGGGGERKPSAEQVYELADEIVSPDETAWDEIINREWI